VNFLLVFITLIIFVIFTTSIFLAATNAFFHALLQFPSNVDKVAFIEKFKYLWSIKVSDALKTTLKTSVFAEPIKSQEAYSAYCSRYEGATFGGGSEKVVMSRCMKL
jgi:hypothetical protein